MRHIRKPFSQLGYIFSDQRRRDKTGDLICNHHKISHLKSLFYASGRIGQKKNINAHTLHQTGGEHHVLHGISFVIMNPALHNNCRYFPDISKQELPIVSLYSRYRKSRNVSIGNLFFHFHIFCISAQP